MIEGNELAEIRPTGKTVSSEKLILRDTGLTTISPIYENIFQVIIYV